MLSLHVKLAAANRAGLPSRRFVVSSRRSNKTCWIRQSGLCTQAGSQRLLHSQCRLSNRRRRRHHHYHHHRRRRSCCCCCCCCCRRNHKSIARRGPPRPTFAREERLPTLLASLFRRSSSVLLLYYYCRSAAHVVLVANVTIDRQSAPETPLLSDRQVLLQSQAKAGICRQCLRPPVVARRQRWPRWTVSARPAVKQGMLQEIPEFMIRRILLFFHSLFLK